MKIVAGMGSVDDYPLYAEAGADEVFCGYVPEEWMERYDVLHPLNRREVKYYNVQIGSSSELMILRDMVEEIHVPVIITLNALQYEPEQYELLRTIVAEGMALGFDRYILADREAWRMLRKHFPKLQLHVSGEYGELNGRVTELLAEDGVQRVIFPRQTEIPEMEALTRTQGIREWEAFVLNERCHFTGAYCNSLHCDELCHMCYVPYRFCGREEIGETQMPTSDSEAIGYSGCGLCALWKLRDAGVTHLKIVSRGNGTEDTIRDIRTLRTALNLLEAASSEEEYLAAMKKQIFPMGCSTNCYYPVER